MLTYEQKKSRKTGQVIAASILVILLLMTGTFAWVSGTQRAFNPRWDFEGSHGGRIHDRFEIEGRGEQDLTVFAENFGETDIYVRMRLHEFLAFDGEEHGIGNADRDNPETWPVYRSSDTNVNERRTGTDASTIGERGIDWTLGQTEAFAFMPTFNRATHEADTIQPTVPALYAHQNAHRMTEATGDAVDWFSHETGTSRDVQGNIEHVSDFHQLGTQTGPGIDVAQHRYLDDGSRNNWAVGETLESAYIYTEIVDPTDPSSLIDLRLGEEREHTAQANLMPSITGGDVPTEVPTNFPGVITIGEWNQWGQPEGDFWIHDTTNEEGWFYWNGFLLAGEDELSTATSLLLAEINIPESWNNTWEYVVMADGEFFVPASLDLVSPSISTLAREIFEGVDERTPTYSVEWNTASRIEMNQGETESLGTVTVTRTYGDGTTEDVPVIFSHTTNVRFEIVGDAGNVTIIGNEITAAPNATLGERNVVAIFTNEGGEEFRSSSRQVIILESPVYTIEFNTMDTITVRQGGQAPIGDVTVTRTIGGESTIVSNPSPAPTFELRTTPVGGDLLGLGLSGTNVTASNVAEVGGGRHIVALWDAPQGPIESLLREITVEEVALRIPDTPHETFEDPDTGTEWRVLVPADDPRGGVGNALIITEYVHMPGTRYHSTVGFTLFQSSEAQSTVRSWWNDSAIVGATMRSVALDYEFQDASGASIARTSTTNGPGIEVDRENGSENSSAGAVGVTTNVTRGLTRPLGPETASTAEPFVLSISEANEYFNGATGAQGRQTGRIGALTTNTIWWLRSPGNGTSATNTNRHSTVNTSGNVGGGMYATLNSDDRGFRPALWVRQ